jgi:hypothetical protein
MFRGEPVAAATRYIAQSMGNHSGETNPGEASSAVGRRDFLRKAAVVGTGAFAAPMVVTVDPADAQALTSPPPEPPGPSTQPEPPGINLVSSPGAETPGAKDMRAAGRRVAERTELPRTGADIDRLVAAGLAATAGGAALVLWSANAQPKSTAPRPTDSEPET